MPDDALRVHEEGRAGVDAALVAEDAVGLADGPMRPVVGEQGKRQVAELLCPDLETRNGIGADLEDLDAQCLELVVVLTEPEDLVLSTPGEGERQEAHKRAATAIGAQGEGFSAVRRQGEFRGNGARL